MNKDLIESLAPQPYNHPGSFQPHYQSITQVNKKIEGVPEFKAVKENMSTNIMESIPTTIVAQKQTVSTGGKTIRVNSR